MKIKVCGMKYEENIKSLIELPIDFIGFIFYKKSARFIESQLDYEFIKRIPKQIKKVGVFVNESSYSILNYVANYDLDFVQLHGNETEDICKQLKPHVGIIKVFHIQDELDAEQLEKFIPYVDYFLFDTDTKEYGGSGKKFNWEILKKYNYSKPFFLSGGISEESIEEIKSLQIQQLIAIDINSKFEIEPGLKNINSINNFIKQLRYDNN